MNYEKGNYLVIILVDIKHSKTRTLTSNLLYFRYEMRFSGEWLCEGQQTPLTIHKTILVFCHHKHDTFPIFSPKQQFHFFVKRGVAIRLFVLCFTVAVAASLSATEISYIFLLSCTSSSALFALYILQRLLRPCYSETMPTIRLHRSHTRRNSSIGLDPSVALKSLSLRRPEAFLSSCANNSGKHRWPFYRCSPTLPLAFSTKIKGQFLLIVILKLSAQKTTTSTVAIVAQESCNSQRQQPCSTTTTTRPLMKAMLVAAATAASG